MEIQLLGTGTPTPSLKRMSSGYLIRVGSDVILFDFGPGTYHRLMEAGVPATDVTHIFFSHLHYDHCLDYARLLLSRWDQGSDQIQELRVFGPSFIERMTEALIGEDGAFGPDLKARTELPVSQAIYQARGGTLPRKRPMPEIVPIKSGDTIEGNEWSVQVRSVPHVQPILECYGFRLETKAGALTYSGDSGPCKAMQLLARDTDVLIHMCHYLSGTELSAEFAKACMGHLELAQLGRDARVKNLVISHVTEQMDVAGVRERIIREMSDIYKGNLFFGEDLMTIPIDGPNPKILN